MHEAVVSVGNCRYRLLLLLVHTAEGGGEVERERVGAGAKQGREGHERELQVIVA